MVEGISFALADDRWQMAPGTRAAIVGILAQVKPKIAVELGTFEGGALPMLAEHSEEVHTFDLDPQVDVVPPNVTTHRGDYFATLPAFLSRLAVDGRNVEFVLIDGATRGDSVRRSVESLLNSDAVTRTVILIHGTMNEEIRRELDYIDYSSYSKIRYADLAFTQLFQAHLPLLEERWGGLGIILVDTDNTVDTRRGIVARPRHWRAHGREATWLTLAPIRRAKREIKHAGARVLRGR